MSYGQDSTDGAVVLVTFRLPREVVAEEAAVVGEFNEWSHTANPMVRDAEGLSATITLRPGRTYRFRYLLDGERWENDWAADAYAPNEFGGDDSVIDLTDAATGAAPPRAAEPAVEPAPPKKAPARKRASRAKPKAETPPS
jgi:1,4-alpha-glucan branching enzyme